MELLVADPEREHAEWTEKQKAQRQEEFEAHREERDQQFSELPPDFQTRIQIFRDANPDFRRDYEAYELFCCTEAANLVDFLRQSPEWAERSGKGLTGQSTKEEIDAALDAYLEDREAQKVASSYEEHSGNTMSATISLARMALYDEIGYKPEGLDDPHPLVVLQHGAMTPLTGCEEYGCVHPRPTP